MIKNRIYECSCEKLIGLQKTSIKRGWHHSKSISVNYVKIKKIKKACIEISDINTNILAFITIKDFKKHFKITGPIRL
jgi:hypothetical protein